MMAAPGNPRVSFLTPRARRAIGYAFAVLILLGLGRILAQTWGDLEASEFRFSLNLSRLVVSLPLLVVARGFAVEAWRRILISLGEYLGFGFGARVWFLSNLTRYVPGNIWQVATMMVMVEERGVSKTNALLSQVIYTAVALSIAAVLGLQFALARPDLLHGLLPVEFIALAPVIATLAAGGLIILLALPAVNRLLVALTARIMRRQINAPAPTLARGLLPPVFSLGMWLFNGIAFYLFTSSLVEVAPERLPAFISMNAGAYLIGYLSFVTPSGLGFREGALAWMLGAFFPTPIAVAISLAARLWSTAGELLGVVLVWIVPEREKRSKQADVL